ncbi:hypothetical protein EXE53_16705 [Halorubrum sp. SD626R]|uniref:hypothetical protein n=1 Tax=Halorubrum sp. SD626R TaxID=1419722 RepID=UPI0010F79849|nr:hypothetical protein [Halorubrum sp. SD626R]TKX79268.1 hypothetical protein EXE53_16705 [Halorubrum sp. SD626R]
MDRIRHCDGDIRGGPVMPNCPVDGCGNPHDTWGGVAVHMWKKQDEDHDMWESKDEALVWLAENGHMSRDTSETDTSPNESASTSPADGGDTADPATTDGGSVAFPENPDADDDPAVKDNPEPDTHVCPSCGSAKVVDADRTLREIPNLSDRHRTTLKTHDKHCIDCGEVFNS